ncbi:MAG: phosphatidylcholine/phosphatidylserine synthase [Phycisphaerae bacterium]|nr:phosphatidylcholine/phosphatidylserine synthase [Phycisphaerae bacterium]
MTLKPVWQPKKPSSDPTNPEPRPKHRHKRLRTVAMLPTLLTLGNLYCGFLAIYYCGREMHDLGAKVDAATVLTLKSQRLEAIAPSYLAVGVIMLIGAMICDSLDGRVARMTGAASKFGIQMDSLADVVSFGVAPGFMMVTLLRRELAEWAQVPLGFERFGQAAVLIGAVFACCTALRLARFNVEASLEEAAHYGFKGLPSPGAAAAVISLIFLHDHLDSVGGFDRLTGAITVFLPIGTLAVSLLMVSRVPYTHLVSLLLSRRPFGQLPLMLLGVLLLLLYPQQVLVILAWAFVFSGPIRYALRLIAGRPVHPAVAPDSDSQAASSTPTSDRKAQ